MDFKTILQKYWIVMITVILTSRSYFLNSFYFAGSTILILLITFLITLTLDKTRKFLRYKTLIFLGVIILLQFFSLTQKENFNILTYITTPFHLVLIILYVSPKTLRKIQEMKEMTERDILPSLFSIIAPFYLCYFLVTRGPNDWFEFLMIIVSGVFGLVACWFLFQGKDESEA